MSADVSPPVIPAADPQRNGTPPSPKRPEWPDPLLFEREPEGIGPLSEEFKASLADRKWIEEELDNDRLLEYSGKCIAVIDRQVVGVGESQLALAHEVAARLGVPSCRVAVTYID